MLSSIESAVRQALETVKDPCMVAGGLDLTIVDLGLVTDVAINDDNIRIEITFTEVGCQFTHRVIDSIYTAVEAVSGEAEVQVVPQWNKAWTPEWMSEVGRVEFYAARERLAERLKAVPVAPNAK